LDGVAYVEPEAIFIEMGQSLGMTVGFYVCVNGTDDNGLVGGGMDSLEDSLSYLCRQVGFLLHFF